MKRVQFIAFLGMRYIKMMYNSLGIAIGSLILFFTLPFTVLSQTCTISGSGTINWTNPGPSCQEGGNAGGSTILVIPAGLTVSFDGNSDTWTGTRIEVYGTMSISAPGQVTINASVVVKNGGVLGISSKLNLGTTDGCGYTLIVESGGVVDIQGSTPDRLNICGNEIARGGSAGCNPYPTGPAPYCEPSGGFTGPTGFDEDGVDGSLPVKLLYFKAKVKGSTVKLNWATSSEENFDRFIIQRTLNGVDFEDIGEVSGTGFNLFNTKTEYSFDDDLPLLGFNYYRLKAVDTEGSFEYFGLVSAQIEGKKGAIVYPNPAYDNNINVKLNFPPSENSQIVVFDLFGAEIGRRQITGIDNPLNFEGRLKSGTYVLKVISGHDQLLTKFVVR